MYAEVVLRSASDSMKAQPLVVEMVREELAKLGFNILASSPYSISIAGSQKQYMENFGVTVRYRYVKARGKKTDRTIQFIITGQLVIPEKLKNIIEDVYVPPVVTFHQLERPMPNPHYKHLKPPQAIVSILEAEGAHLKRITGKNVQVAMIDSGINKLHKYYDIHNRNKIYVHPNTTNDEIGHGTAMAANLLAIAPDCEFHLYSIYQIQNTANNPALAAFNNAVAGGAKVISISWALAAVDSNVATAIKDAVNQGITVVCSVGNKPAKYPGFPSCMNEVISVGGAYILKKNGKLTASSFAVSGKNPHPDYQNRQCPDVCGICGSKNFKGRLIVMPTKSNSVYDKERHIEGNDKTDPDDGWCVGSGTSAATAQVAGGVALLLEANPNLTPSEIKKILRDTATDVKGGRSSTNQDAWENTNQHPDPDDATGMGLINLDKAVDEAIKMAENGS